MNKEQFLEAIKGRAGWAWIEPKVILTVRCDSSHCDLGKPAYLPEGPYRVQGKDYTFASLESNNRAEGQLRSYRPVETPTEHGHYREAERWEIRKYERGEVAV